MKLLMTFAWLMLLGHGAWAAEAFFYVAGSQGIYRDSLDTDTGKLGPLTLAGAAKDPNFLALAPDGKSLYATLDGAVESFAVQPDGALRARDQEPSGGAGPCYVSVDETGRHVFVANYDGGSIACFGANPDGSLGERTAFIPLTGTGPNPKRQTKPYAHSIYPVAGDKFVYACDLGTDHVWIFRFDAAHGTLTPSHPPFAPVPPGNGPRHLAFHPNGKFVYAASEIGCSVTAFSRDAAGGALTALQTISALPPGKSVQGVTTAEIACHPSGRWLDVSNRGCDTISVFMIAADGRLTFRQSVPSVVQMPRSFAIDPTGRWLIAAGQKDNRLAVLKVDPVTGRLTATEQVVEMASPICVLFTARK